MEKTEKERENEKKIEWTPITTKKKKKEKK